MKTRYGFVSNSSSSSFVILGIKRRLSDIQPTEFNKKNTRFFVEPDGLDGGEGPQYFYMEDKDTLAFFKKHAEYVNTVYQILAEGGDGEVDVTNVKFPKGARVVLIGGDMDQHCPGDLDGIKEVFGYSDINIDDTREQIMLRFQHGTSNKFYEMTDNGDGTFTGRHGKIGTEGVCDEYDIDDWDRKYKEKINKGYV